MSKVANIDGQLEFKFVDGKVVIDNNFEQKRQREAIKAQKDYYEAWLFLLEKYGKYSQINSLHRAILRDHSEQTEKIFQKNYGGELIVVEQVKMRSKNAVKKAAESLRKKAIFVNVFDIGILDDDFLCEKKRREKYRKIIKRELQKIEASEAAETTEVYGLADLEAEYQTAKAIYERRKARQN